MTFLRRIFTPWFGIATYNIRYDKATDRYHVFCDQDGETVQTFAHWDDAVDFLRVLSGKEGL